MTKSPNQTMQRTPKAFGVADLGLVRRMTRCLPILLALAIPFASTIAQTGALDLVSQGDSRAKLGNLDGALADYNRAIELDSACAGAYHGRAVIEATRWAYNEALKDVDRSIELAPTNDHFLSVRGNIKRADGDVDGAIADYNHAIELSPKDYLPFLNRGIAKCLKGKWPDAVSDLRTASDLDPTAGTYARLLIWVARAHIAQTEQARQELADYFKQESSLRTNWPIRIGRFLCGDVTTGDFLDSGGLAAPKGTKANKAFVLKDSTNSTLPESTSIDHPASSNYFDPPTPHPSRFLYGGDARDLAVLSTALFPNPERFAGRCQAWFYVGMKRLVADDKKTAKEAFEDCISTRQMNVPEYQLAQAELKTLSQANRKKQK